MISYEYYLSLVWEAEGQVSAESMMMDMGYPPNMPNEVDNYKKLLEIVYAVARSDLKALQAISGKTLTAFAGGLKIPYRSIQNWVAGETSPSAYDIQFIGYAMIGDIYAEETEV